MKPQQAAATVVLVGSFRLSDFSVEALIKTGGVRSLGPTTLELLVPGQAVVLNLAWGKVAVTENRLSIDANELPFVMAVDLATRLVNEVSAASVVRKFGINLNAHFDFQSIEARDRFGARFAPPDVWGSFGKAVKASFKKREERHGGLMRLHMRQASPPDRDAGWLDVTLEPSSVVKNNTGVHVAINDHYELAEKSLAAMRHDERSISDYCVQLLNERFDDSIGRSLALCDELTGTAA